MGAAKELWFECMERRFNELLAQGWQEEDAYEAAGEQAQDLVVDVLADRADNERKRLRESA